MMRFFEARPAAIEEAGAARVRRILAPGMGFFLGARASDTLSALADLGHRDIAFVDGGSVCIEVRDTGVGIAPEELPHVFDRFYRGARTGEVRATGSGLGLSIVRSIVEMHGGRVAIESQPGKGTTVIVELPREVAQSSPRASPV